MSKILVLGGAGYIGSHTVYELLDNGYEVVVADSLETGHRRAVHPEAQLYVGDIRDRAFMDSILDEEKIDAVVHFAAYSLVGESMYGLASIIGPLAGGFITDSLGWRWIFYVNLPLGAFAAAVVAVAMPQYSASGRRKTKDIPGIAALVLTFVPFLLCLSEAGKSFAWGSLPCVGLLAFAAAMLAVFVRIEKRSENPLIPLGFFRNGAIGVSFALAFLSQAVMRTEANTAITGIA